jgi:hypothetical protein
VDIHGLDFLHVKFQDEPFGYVRRETEARFPASQSVVLSKSDVPTAGVDESRLSTPLLENDAGDTDRPRSTIASVGPFIESPVRWTFAYETLAVLF